MTDTEKVAKKAKTPAAGKKIKAPKAEKKVKGPAKEKKTKAALDIEDPTSVAKRFKSFNFFLFLLNLSVCLVVMIFL